LLFDVFRQTDFGLHFFPYPQLSNAKSVYIMTPHNTGDNAMIVDN